MNFAYHMYVTCIHMEKSLYTPQDVNPQEDANKRAHTFMIPTSNIMLPCMIYMQIQMNWCLHGSCFKELLHACLPVIVIGKPGSKHWDCLISTSPLLHVTKRIFYCMWRKSIMHAHLRFNASSGRCIRLVGWLVGLTCETIDFRKHCCMGCRCIISPRPRATSHNVKLHSENMMVKPTEIRW